MPIKSAFASNLPTRTRVVLKRAGENLRLARLRRRLTMEDVARRLGVDRRTIAAMETGKPQVASSVIAGALWVYGLERDFELLGDPERDALGRGLEARDRPRVARRKALDDDF